MKTLFFTILALYAVHCFGQTPVIQKVEPLITFPNDTIVISGNGFSTNAALLEVWFGSVKGTIVTSSDFAIEVIVPAQALMAPVEVINLTSKLSGKSNDKFNPAFGGTSFDALKFTTQISFSATEELWDICTCDLNNDGKPDIASTKFKRTSPFATPTDIMVLQNNSTTGTAGNANTLAFTKLDKTNLPVLNLTFPSDNIVCGDLSGDGKPELVVTRAGSPRNSIHIFRNTSTAGINFASPLTLFMDVGHFATRMAIRDLNKDGKPEIIATNSFNDIFYIFINQSSAGNISFSSTPLKMSIKIGSADVLTTYETDVQDFNGDNLPDILINQFQTNDVYILKNKSNGSISFEAPQKINIQGAFNRLVSADFNKDGLLDIVATSTLNDRADVLINKSTSTTFAFNSPVVLTTSFEPWGVDVGDIDGDKDADIVFTNRNRPAPVASELKINVFTNDGNANPAFTRNDITTTQQTRNVKIADMDGDAKPDIVFTDFSESPVSSRLGIIRNTNCHKPVIQNIGPLTICNGQTIRLNTIPANNVTYTWKEGAGTVGTNQPFLNITTPGSYTVTATGEGGACVEVSQTITVTVDAASAPVDPVITTNSPLCSGASLTLSTSAIADSYAWTGPDGFTSTTKDPAAFTVSSDNAGLYTLQTKVGACKSNIISRRVDVADLENFSISSNSASNILCSGNSVTLSVNNLQGYTFQWKKNNVAVTGQISSVLNATEEGSYTVVVTSPPTLTCAPFTTPPFELTFIAPPVSAYTLNAKGCINEPVNFTNQSQVDSRATTIYTWTFGNGQSSSELNPTHTYTSVQAFNTSLNVRYEGVSNCESNSNKSIDIVNATLPVISAAATSACADKEVTLSLPTGFSSVLWNTSEVSNSISKTPGTYSVITTDANGCKGEDDIIIASKALPILVLVAQPPVIPLGANSQLTASGAVEYNWTPVETLDNAFIANPLASPLVTTAYTVIGKSAEGCEASGDITLTVAGVISFPVAFSPNGDGDNEIWNIRAENNPDCTLSIFDGRGSRVFESKGENWDGTYKSNVLPEGTYYYVFTCPDKKPVTGSVLLFK